MLQAIFGFLSRPKQVMSVEMSRETNDTLWTWFSNKLRWRPTSLEDLAKAESNILSYVKNRIDLSFVSIVHKDKACQIRTLVMDDVNNEELSKRTPLVLLHGLGSAVGLWVMNLDSLSKNRPLYALDILGFGQSSRPSFSGGAEEVENELVESIENWRKQMKLKKFILLGHSMGGYLATSYAIKYPDRVRHLVLADPWGFPERDETASLRIHLPLWVKIVGSVMKYFNPMTAVRVAGPWGPKIIKRVRPDIIQKYTILVDDPDIVSDYIYHCNAQNPTGETAFKTMSFDFGWAKRPMLQRVENLQEDVPITFVYGSRSWIDSKSGYTIQKMRAEKCNVDVLLVPRAGHHVYADQPDLFHAVIHDVCDKVDKDTKPELYGNNYVEDPVEKYLNYAS